MYNQRIENLQNTLQERNIEALLVTHAANRYYLSGFELHDPQCNESAGCLLIPAKGPAWLLTDPRYKIAAQNVWPQEFVEIYSGKRLQHIANFVKKQGISTLTVEAAAISFKDADILAKDLYLEASMELVEKLRLYKDSLEIEALSRSCALNHKVFDLLQNKMLPGITEQELAWEIEKLFRENGASELSFATIVGVGPNAALPHAIPGPDRITENCPLLIDMGGRLGDYCSDQTRSFWIGPQAASYFQEALEMVQEAQLRAINAIGPGMEAREAYAVARNFFAAYGQEKYFTHALGHGIGLETHEMPSLSPVSSARLEPGMVVTVEPGLYYPQWGGIRWEHMVVITENGTRML